MNIWFEFAWICRLCSLDTARSISGATSSESSPSLPPLWPSSAYILSQLQHIKQRKWMQNDAESDAHIFLSRSACLSLLDWPFTWLPQVLDDIHCNENEDLTVASHMCCGLIVTSKHQKPTAFHMPVIWVGLQLLHTYVECLAFTSIHDDVQRNSNARFKLLTPNCSTINDSCKLMHIQLLRWHVKGSRKKICISKPCFLHLSPWCPPSIAEIKTLYCPACVLHRRSVWIETFQNKLESVQTSQAINHQLHNDMWIMYMCKYKNLQ